jgi:hypothetical protein
MSIVKQTVNKKIATRLLKTLSPNDELDMAKVSSLITEMDAGRWNPEQSKKEPIGIHHDDKSLINGRHRIAAFLASRLQTMDVYVMDNV